MNKKGAELSLNVIILAALGILVLLILFAVFSGQLSKSSKKIDQIQEGKKQVLGLLQSAGISISELQNECTDGATCNTYLEKKGLGGTLVAYAKLDNTGLTEEDCFKTTSNLFICLR